MGIIKDTLIAAASYYVGRNGIPMSNGTPRAVTDYIQNTPLKEYIENYMAAHNISFADKWFKDEIDVILR